MSVTMSSSRLASGGLSTLPGFSGRLAGFFGPAPLPLLITVATQLSEKTNSPSPRSSTRLGNSWHSAINRGAPLPVAGVVAAHGAAGAILHPEWDRSRPPRPERAPIPLAPAR